MKPMPVCSMHAATCSGCSSMAAPSASSASALPDLDDTLRLPCLATRAPAAAATNIAQVEMLKVCEPSPPVPTMSTRLGIGHRHRQGEFAHHGGRGGDLADGFLLHAQAGEDGGGHHRRDVAAHDLPHQVDHFVEEDFAVFDGALQGFLGEKLMGMLLDQAAGRCRNCAAGRGRVR
jgi:hypothetical protein